MPIDRSQLVSPLAEQKLPDLPKPTGEERFISPFQITEEAEKLHQDRPDIGPLEEIEGMLTLGTSLIATPIAGLGGISQAISNELGIGERIPPEKYP